MARTDALPRLLPRVFMPYWSAAGMNDALAMVERLVTEVPIIHLRCLPDSGGVAELERVLDT